MAESDMQASIASLHADVRTLIQSDRQMVEALVDVRECIGELKETMQRGVVAVETATALMDRLIGALARAFSSTPGVAAMLAVVGAFVFVLLRGLAVPVDFMWSWIRGGQ
jgi:hypothetical protein